MSNVTYIQPDGCSQSVDVPVGLSVMMGGVNAGIPGIVAECGGRYRAPPAMCMSRRRRILSQRCRTTRRTCSSGPPRLGRSPVGCPVSSSSRLEDETMVVRVPDKQL